MKQLLSDQERLVLVAALVAYAIKYEGRVGGPQIAEVLAKFAGTDKRVWVDDGKSSDLYGGSSTWDTVCPLTKTFCDQVNVCARKRECRHTAPTTRLVVDDGRTP